MKISTKELVLTAMFTAVLSVLSILAIPTPSGVPITLQTFAMALCGYVIGEKMGTASTALYVVIGFIGVPVFAGMSGGPSVLFGASGGYIFGFILMTFFCGIGIHFKNKFISILCGLVGLACCHIIGIIQLKIILSMTWIAALLAGTVPFLLKDIISVIAAYIVSLAVRKALAKAHLLDTVNTNA